jgi:predicted enzyme related to lactoylglutathione lyase
MRIWAGAPVSPFWHVGSEVTMTGGILMDDEGSPPQVRQLRLVVETDDFEEAVAFYRDGLGLTEEFSVESEGGALVMALRAGRATLEIVNPAQRRLIDQLEVGEEVSRSIRVAFQVADATSATTRLVAAGADLVASPTETPWRSLNSRLEAPAGLQITLFEELEDID